MYGRSQKINSPASFFSQVAPEVRQVNSTTAEVSWTYHVDQDNVVDFTKVDLRLKFHDVVEDPSCKRVNGTELRRG